MLIERLSSLLLYGLLVLSSTVARADDWVVGSFSDYERARAEAARLGDALGVPVRISEAHPHRLLVDTGSINPDLARTAFRAAGVEGAWRLRRPVSGAPAAMPDKATWLLLGDFGDVQASIDVEIRLSRSFRGVVGESVIEAGRLHHRIMLGPILAADLPEVRRRLAALGFDAPTPIDPPAGAHTGFATVKSAAPEPKVRPATDRATPPAKARDGFNFATLRRRSETTASPR